VFPIGIDVGDGADEAEEAAQAEVVKRMTDSLMGRTLMIGVDRPRLQQGLVERFHAYQHFLETYPDMLGRITYMQIAPLSRSDVRAYVEIRKRWSRPRAHQRALRRHGLDADPLSQSQLSARDADGVAARLERRPVTPLRDGMNLVAKEYVAAQSAEDPGVLNPVESGGGGVRADGRAAGQSVRHSRGEPGDPGGADDVVTGASRASRRDAAGSQAQRHRHLDAPLRRSAGTGAAAENARVRVVRNH
jgi:trehalose 6-phosphate synthase